MRSAEIGTVIQMAIGESGGPKRWLRLNKGERTFALYQVIWRLVAAGVIIQGIGAI